MFADENSQCKRNQDRVHILDTSLYGNEIKLLIKLHSCSNDVN